MTNEDIIDGLTVISRKRGYNVGQGDIIIVLAAIEALRRTPPEGGVTVPRDVAEYCLESAMMLRQRLEIARSSPEYRRVCEVQTKLEDALTSQPQKS